MSGGGIEYATSTSDIPEQYRSFVDNTLNAVGSIANTPASAYQFGYTSGGQQWRPEWETYTDAEGNQQRRLLNPDTNVVTGGQARISPFAADQQAAFNMTRQNVGAYNPALQHMTNMYSGLTDMNATTAPLMASAVNRGDIRDVSGVTGYGGIQNYMNPYENQVVNQTMQDMNRANALAAENARLGSAGRGAFGSQNDLAQTELQRNFLDRTGAMAGQLRQQGFGQAASLAQQDAARAQQAAMANQGVDASIASLRSSQMMNAINQGTANQLAALQGLGGTAQLGQNMRAADINALASQGAAQQALNQAMRDVDYADFMQQANYPIQAANMRLAALGMAPMGSVSTVPVQQQSGLGSALGGIGGLLGGVAGFF